MLIKTTGEAFASTAVFASLVPTKADDLDVKTRNDDAGNPVPKIAPDNSGRTQLRTSLQAMSLDEEGKPSRQEKDVSVAILEPSDIQFGHVYDLKGNVWVTHYVTNAKRIGVSIVAEGIKEHSTGQAPRANENK